MEWMLLPLQKYADFSGRSRRKEYWMFVLGVVIAGIIASIIDGILGMQILSALVGLAVIIPSIACQVRRFHDQDKSGWFVLLGLIPVLGFFIILYFMVQEGTQGQNKFGPDPKSGAISA